MHFGTDRSSLVFRPLSADIPVSRRPSLCGHSSYKTPLSLRACLLQDSPLSADIHVTRRPSLCGHSCYKTPVPLRTFLLQDAFPSADIILTKSPPPSPYILVKRHLSADIHVTRCPSLCGHFCYKTLLPLWIFQLKVALPCADILQTKSPSLFVHSC